MSSSARIEYTHSSWNPVTGCSRVSAGCLHCYAERMAKRLQGMGVPKYRNGFEVTLHPDVLEDPLHWKKPRLIFVNSMSDLFHEKIPIKYLRQIFEVMARADWHVFQVLTKRAERLAELAPKLDWPPNVWMGVTVESSKFTSRIDLLRQTGAAIKWLSMEPLLTEVPGMNLSGIDWIVVGGESGPGARPMKKEWVVDIQRQCREQKVHFFFKQWGGVNKKKTGRKLNGRVYEAMPPLPEPSGQITFGL
jgi:protein gp37